MITHNRPSYTRLSLQRLLDSCNDTARVWLWHNGTDAATLDVVRAYVDHPRVLKFQHSEQNAMLRTPTNWLWEHASGEFVAKVDDDCLVPLNWIDMLTRAHRDCESLGAVACWPFLLEDFDPSLGGRKIRSVSGGHQVLVNPWVGGSGYIMKRSAVLRHGLLRESDSFSAYCMRLALGGLVNGWYFPLLLMDHMDDPRSPHTLMTSERAFAGNRSLSSIRFGVESYEDFCRKSIQAAMDVQRTSPNARDYVGIRGMWRRALARIRRTGIARFSA